MSGHIIEVPVTHREGYHTTLRTKVQGLGEVIWGREFKNPKTQEVEAIQVYDVHGGILFDWEPSQGNLDLNRFKTAQHIAKQSIKAKVGA